MKLALVKTAHLELYLCAVDNDFNIAYAGNGVTTNASWLLAADHDEFYDIVNGVPHAARYVSSMALDRIFIGGVVRAAILSNLAVATLPDVVTEVFYRMQTDSVPKSESVQTPAPKFPDVSAHDFWVLASDAVALFFARLQNVNGIIKLSGGGYSLIATHSILVCDDDEFISPAHFMSEVGYSKLQTIKLGKIHAGNDGLNVLEFVSCTPHFMGSVLTRCKVCNNYLD